MTKPSRDGILVEELRRLFRYEAHEGKLYWAVPVSNVAAGRRVGEHRKNGYHRIRIKRRYYAYHRVVWAMVHGEWPSLSIDHINGVKDDNRIANLRLATAVQNLANKNADRPSMSGYRGLCWDKRKKRWRASARVNGKRVCFGRYKDPYDAHLAYCRGIVAAHGEFAPKLVRDALENAQRNKGPYRERAEYDRLRKKYEGK